MISTAAALVGVLAAGCASNAGGATATGSAHSTVSVLYAGSLLNLMEQHIGPAFEKATGDGYSGFGAGSSEVAADIASRAKTGDVFISASPKADTTIEGAKGGDWVRWYVTFGTAPLVVAYSPKSRFAAQFRHKPWYDVLTEPGIRVGRTDPKLDPKGELTVAALSAAQTAYHRPGLAAAIARHSQVFPEEDLLGRLSAGQLDAGFFYTNETAPAHLPFVDLGKVKVGATFTATVLDRAPHPAAAAAFVRYLLTAAKPALTAGGIHVGPTSLSGAIAAVPAALRPLVRG